MMRSGLLPLALLLLAAGALLASCTLASRPAARAEPAPAIYRSRHTFAVKPLRPELPGYRGSHTEYTGKEPPPPLPAAPGAGQASLALGPDGLPVGPTPHGMPAYDPRGLMPVRQLIYGGTYGERGADRPYELTVGDELTLVLEEHPELSGPLTVRTDGSVELPLVKRRVEAAGRTVAQLRGAIIRVLGDYARNPDRVTLGVDFAAGRHYFVFGAVRRPGRYPMGYRNITVAEAVFRANTDPADAAAPPADVQERLRTETEVKLRRNFRPPPEADLESVHLVTPHRSRPVRTTVNVKAALLEGRGGNNPYLQSGQIVFVNTLPPPPPETPEGEGAGAEASAAAEPGAADAPSLFYRRFIRPLPLREDD